MKSDTPRREVFGWSWFDSLVMLNTISSLSCFALIEMMPSIFRSQVEGGTFFIVHEKVWDLNLDAGWAKQNLPLKMRFHTFFFSPWSGMIIKYYCVSQLTEQYCEASPTSVCGRTPLSPRIFLSPARPFSASDSESLARITLPRES